MPRAAVLSWSLCRWLLICGGLLCLAPPARADSSSVAVAGAPALKRGLNVSNWFTDGQRQPLVLHDFEVIKKAGFDHVRIPINPELLGFSLADASTGRVLFDFGKLDDAVNWARDVGLAVILDIHPTEGFNSLIEQDPRAGAGMVALWSRIVEHYKTYPGGIVVLELLNEPGYRDDFGKYHALIADGVEAIRKISPDSVIIADIPKSAALDGLDGFTPLDDPRVYYAFHFYEPYIFTHQGMRSTAQHGRALRYFRNVPYPSTQVDQRADYAPSAADILEARKELNDYVLARWDAGHLAARVKVAADWARANHRTVICTEFGAVRKTINPAPRYLWIEHARKAFEANGIGWDVWDYADTFGITKLTGATVVDPTDGSTRLADPSQGSRDFEPEAVKALFQN